MKTYLDIECGAYVAKNGNLEELGKRVRAQSLSKEGCGPWLSRKTWKVGRVVERGRAPQG